MSGFSEQVGRRHVFFSDHALDRWWERESANGTHGRQQAMDLLRMRLQSSWTNRSLPPWARVSLWHRARAWMFLYIDEDSGFVVNKNADGDLVAVTFLATEQTSPDGAILRQNAVRGGRIPVRASR